MDCPNCEIPMEKDGLHANSKEKVSLVTTWRCKKCGHREVSQYNIPK